MSSPVSQTLTELRLLLKSRYWGALLFNCASFTLPGELRPCLTSAPLSVPPTMPRLGKADRNIFFPSSKAVYGTLSKMWIAGVDALSVATLDSYTCEPLCCLRSNSNPSGAFELICFFISVFRCVYCHRAIQRRSPSSSLVSRRVTLRFVSCLRSSSHFAPSGRPSPTTQPTLFTSDSRSSTRSSSFKPSLGSLFLRSSSPSPPTSSEASSQVPFERLRSSTFECLRSECWRVWWRLLFRLELEVSTNPSESNSSLVLDSTRR